jgi:chromosome segregation ATPase
MSFYLGRDGQNDILDTRDIEDRIDELESEIESLDDERESFEDSITEIEDEISELEDNQSVDGENQGEIDGLELDKSEYQNRLVASVNENEEAQSELNELTNLRDSIGSEFPRGVTLIHESHFKEYAMQYADDVGAIADSHSWPLTCIDWDQAAEELQQDFSSVDLNGESYYFNA